VTSRDALRRDAGRVAARSWRAARLDHRVQCAARTKENPMKQLTLTMILILASAAGCKGKSAEAQCDDIYQKGTGDAPYKTDKAKFIEACVKTSDNTRRCMLLKGKDRFKDDKCGPSAEGNSFDEQHQLGLLGQGTGTP
jgi:hypothetical protein